MKNNAQVIITNNDSFRWVPIVQTKVKAQVAKLFALYNSAQFNNTMYMK